MDLLKIDPRGFSVAAVGQERAGVPQQHVAAFLNGSLEPQQIAEDANDRAILESVKAFLSERMQVGHCCRALHAPAAVSVERMHF